jgi:hypothetical protein
MQTFRVGFAIDLKAVITQEFLNESRKEAQAEEATVFLKECQERFPDDDDQFMLAIVTNAFRSSIRHNALWFMSQSGVGGSVSPVQVTNREIAVPKVFSETPPPEKIVERKSKADTLLLGFDPGVPPREAQHQVEVPAA